MGTTHKNFSKLTAGVSTRADLISYFNANMDAIDALLRYISQTAIGIGASAAQGELKLRDAAQILLETGAGKSAIQIWKDLTPSSAIAIGMCCPGETLDSNLHLSLFNGTAWSDALTLYADTGGAYFIEAVSATGFTDRTPAFSGDALAAIRKIRSTEKGEIDHASLPDFAVSPYRDEMGEWWPGRSLGDMVSVLTVAIQQLAASYDAAIAERDSKIEELSKRIDALAAKLPA